MLGVLAALPRLGALYLRGNPLVAGTRHYRKTALLALPRSLRYLDDAPVDALERAATAAWASGGPAAETAVRAAHTAGEAAAARARADGFKRWQAGERARRAAERAATDAGGGDGRPVSAAYVSYTCLLGAGEEEEAEEEEGQGADGGWGGEQHAEEAGAGAGALIAGTGGIVAAGASPGAGRHALALGSDEAEDADSMGQQCPPRAPASALARASTRPPPVFASAVADARRALPADGCVAAPDAAAAGTRIAGTGAVAQAPGGAATRADSEGTATAAAAAGTTPAAATSCGAASPTPAPPAAVATAAAVPPHTRAAVGPGRVPVRAARTDVFGVGAPCAGAGGSSAARVGATTGGGDPQPGAPADTPSVRLTPLAVSLGSGDGGEPGGGWAGSQVAAAAEPGGGRGGPSGGAVGTSGGEVGISAPAPLEPNEGPAVTLAESTIAASLAADQARCESPAAATGSGLSLADWQALLAAACSCEQRQTQAQQVLDGPPVAGAAGAGHTAAVAAAAAGCVAGAPLTAWACPGTSTASAAATAAVAVPTAQMQRPRPLQQQQPLATRPADDDDDSDGASGGDPPGAAAAAAGLRLRACGAGGGASSGGYLRPPTAAQIDACGGGLTLLAE